MRLHLAAVQGRPKDNYYNVGHVSGQRLEPTEDDIERGGQMDKLGPASSGTKPRNEIEPVIFAWNAPQYPTILEPRLAASWSLIWARWATWTLLSVVCTSGCSPVDLHRMALLAQCVISTLSLIHEGISR